MSAIAKLTSPLRCAVYARKTTDDTAQAEDNRSTTRQVELASAYAVAKGWTVDPALLFVDDAVSGAEFKTRPGPLRLLAHVRDFDVLVLRDQDRLGRDAMRTIVLLDDLIASGRRIFYYSNDQQELLDPAALLTRTGTRPSGPQAGAGCENRKRPCHQGGERR